MNPKLIILILGILLVTAGCSASRTPVMNTIELTNVNFIQARKAKESEACGVYLLGFIGPFGDPQVMRAVRKGNISKVFAVDYRSAYYILYSLDCVVVYGK